MTIFKKLIIRFLAIAALLVLSNEVYRYTLWETDYTKIEEWKVIADVIQRQDSADILYFGESSNVSSHGDDQRKESISYFISEYFPAEVLLPINKDAAHAGTYLSLIKKIKKEARVKTVIVTMNLRSFNSAWIHSYLEPSISRIPLLASDYPPLYKRFILSFPPPMCKTKEETYKAMAKQWKKETLVFPYPFPYKNVMEWDKVYYHNIYFKPDGSRDVEKSDLACHYIKSYAFQIDTLSNPRIKDFDEIVNVCQEKKLNLVFNLLAENVEYADSLVGKDLVYLMKQNRDLLMKRYNKGNVRVVDNLEKVPGKYYIDQNWTTEHYQQFGRETIAKNVALRLKDIYPNK